MIWRWAIRLINWIAPWKRMSPKTMRGLMLLYLVTINGIEGGRTTPNATPKQRTTVEIPKHDKAVAAHKEALAQSADVFGTIDSVTTAGMNIYEKFNIQDEVKDVAERIIEKEVAKVASQAAEDAIKDKAMKKAQEELIDTGSKRKAAEAAKKKSLELGGPAAKKAAKEKAKELVDQAYKEANEQLRDEMAEKIADKEAKKQANKISRKVTKTSVKKTTEKLGKAAGKKAGEAAKKGATKLGKAIAAKANKIAKATTTVLQKVAKTTAKILSKLGPALGALGPLLSIASIFMDMGPSAELQEIQEMRQEMNEQFEKTQELIKEGFKEMRGRFDKIDKKLYALGQKMDELGQKIDKVAQKIDELGRKMEDVKFNIQFAIAVNTYREKRVALKTMHRLFNAFTENIADSQAQEAFYYQCKQYNPWLLMNWIYEHLLIHDLPDGAPAGMYSSILKAVGPNFTLLQEWNEVIKNDVMSIVMIHSFCLGITGKNQTLSKYQLSELEEIEVILPKIEEKMVKMVEVLEDGFTKTVQALFVKDDGMNRPHVLLGMYEYGFVDWIHYSGTDIPEETQRCVKIRDVGFAWCPRITPEQREQAIKAANSICQKSAKAIKRAGQEDKGFFVRSYFNAMLTYFKVPCGAPPDPLNSVITLVLDSNTSCLLQPVCNPSHWVNTIPGNWTMERGYWIIDPYNGTLPYGPPQ